mmetsp:Transcript_17234/g.37487  ORF Transcript_17234/g.37487 Transcript_17234/m.37487 type:complete len:238 (-) Transcript_17234:96-809(-)
MERAVCVGPCATTRCSIAPLRKTPALTRSTRVTQRHIRLRHGPKHVRARETARKTSAISSPEWECDDEDGCIIPDDYAYDESAVSKLEVTNETSTTGDEEGGRAGFWGMAGALFGGGEKEPKEDVVTITSMEQFDDVVSQNPDKAIVVDCSMTFCGPCKVVYPTFNMYAENYTDSIFCHIVGDTNDSTKALLSRLKVQAVPTFFIFKGGKKTFEYTGKNMKNVRAGILANLNDSDAR